MTDRDKVIKGLECCRRLPDSMGDCNRLGCPYEAKFTSCIESLCTDALELLKDDETQLQYRDEVIYEEEKETARLRKLLKEQKTRVMTLEEVKAFDWDYCYLEEERLPGKEYRSVCGDYALTCITWPCVASMRIQHGDNNYGKKWRCWTARPTDEQRKAVMWE